ncbi:hypothetical protein C8J56DRAFT_892998 [Mycena floridula]|nr:hypothetical protein C8J56DRAFT_892998 [Mycena floridula]
MESGIKEGKMDPIVRRLNLAELLRCVKSCIPECCLKKGGCNAKARIRIGFLSSRKGRERLSMRERRHEETKEKIIWKEQEKTKKLVGKDQAKESSRGRDIEKSSDWSTESQRAESDDDTVLPETLLGDKNNELRDLLKTPRTRAGVFPPDPPYFHSNSPSTALQKKEAQNKVRAVHHLYDGIWPYNRQLKTGNVAPLPFWDNSTPQGPQHASFTSLGSPRHLRVNRKQGLNCSIWTCDKAEAALLHVLSGLLNVYDLSIVDTPSGHKIPLDKNAETRMECLDQKFIFVVTLRRNDAKGQVLSGSATVQTGVER